MKKIVNEDGIRFFLGWRKIIFCLGGEGFFYCEGAKKKFVKGG